MPFVLVLARCLGLNFLNLVYKTSAKIEKEPFTLKLKSPLKARIDIVPFKLGLARGHSSF